MSFDDSALSETVENNIKAAELEKDGQIDAAITLYEKNLSLQDTGYYPYERLAILYRKRKDYTNEIRVLETYLDLYQRTVDPRYILQDRLESVQERIDKAKELQYQSTHTRTEAKRAKAARLGSVMQAVGSHQLDSYYSHLDEYLKSPCAGPDTYVVIDLETTGIVPYRDRIIEMAAIRVEYGRAVDSISFLVNPGIPIAPAVQHVTGITNEMVANAPPLCEVLPDFMSFLGEDVIVGHNVNFDLRFLSAACDIYTGRPFSWTEIDTLTMSRRLYPELKHYKLADLAAAFSIHTDTFHRALDDVYTTYKCYLHMLADLEMREFELDEFLTAREGIARESDSVPEEDDRKPVFHGHTSVRHIVASVSSFDESSPLYGKTFVFTGELSMSREEAMQAVVDRGGKCASSVSGRTDFLIVGRNEYMPDNPEYKSTKQKKAELLQQSGASIRIISEEDFCSMLEVSHV